MTHEKKVKTESSQGNLANLTQRDDKNRRSAFNICCKKNSPLSLQGAVLNFVTIFIVTAYYRMI